MAIAAVGVVSPAYWYLTRATGVMSLLLLTCVVALGVANAARLTTSSWPRFLTDGVHRRASMLALAFLAIHIITTVLDTFVSISLFDAVIPFIGSYRPFWLGLGAAAFDMLLAVWISSLLRARVGARTWRSLHWLAYACWPVAVLHSIGTGTDVHQGWMFAVYVVCVAVLIVALWVRLRAGAYMDSVGRTAVGAAEARGR